LQPDSKRVVSQWLTIDDPRASPEITWQGPQIQAFIQPPRVRRNDARPVCAYVLGETFLRTMAHVQAAEIHSYGEGNAFFEPACNALHETPLESCTDWEGWVFEGGNDSSHNTLDSSVINKDFRKSSGPWVLANRIHDGTGGLSTPPEAVERIGSIQRIPRLPLPSLDE
jgi:hypothetical protein